MDFVSDQLVDDRRLRVLVIIENFTRECLALDARSKIHGMNYFIGIEGGSYDGTGGRSKLRIFPEGNTVILILAKSE